MDDFDDITFDDYDFDTGTTNQANNNTNNNNNTQPGQSSFDDLPAFGDTPIESTPKKIKARKFDEALLLEPEGLPLLKSESRFLHFRGKHHEADDLRRLMTYYTIWADNLFPKYKFSHFAKVVGNHTKGKRVKEALSEWQDEYKEKMQVRRNQYSELSGQTVGDEEGGSAREEEVSSDDDNQPLFFPMSADVAERLQKEKKKTAKPKVKKTKYRSNNYIRSDEDQTDDDEDNVVTKKPRTITFSDDEAEAAKPTDAKSGREYALSILAEKRKQRQLAQQRQKEEEKEKERNKPAKTVDELMEEYNDDVQLALSDNELAQLETVNDEFDDIVMESIDDII
ncbi:hypothetical protein INT47_001889 [Mucor saturninus]|uniref:Chromosome segregation in meiosis protein n=1 Tax=Mucor saturninus TaxID=64648 RepID=A0A8H7REL0_9FUNG|nr:hypothetical protein INT47_001889 [Mucor saturninus]